MVRVQVKGVNRIRKRVGGRVVEMHYLRGVQGQPAFWRSDSGVLLGSDAYLRAYAEARRRPQAGGRKMTSTLIGGYAERARRARDSGDEELAQWYERTVRALERGEADAAELRAARDENAALRETLDRADTCLRHCVDYENRAHVDAMNAAHDALTDTDTAAQDWRERVLAEGRREGRREAAEVVRDSVAHQRQHMDDANPGIAYHAAHDVERADKMADAILALNEKEDRDG